MSYQPPKGFMTLTQARERLGMSAVTLRLRIASGRLETYQNGRDSRVTLVKVEDVERLILPQRKEPSS